MGMKGQIFLTIAILFTLFLVVLRNGLNTTEILECQKTLEENLDRLEFENIRSEFPDGSIVSFNNTVNMTNNTINFTRYVQLVEQSKGLTFNAFSVQTAYPNLTASVASDMNATVFNLLGEQILFLNLTNADQSGSQSFTTTNVPDNTTVSSPFTINIGSDTNFTFYVFWNTSTRNSTDSFFIPAQIS